MSSLKWNLFRVFFNNSFWKILISTDLFNCTWRLRILSLDSSPPIESSDVEWDSSRISVFPSLLNVSSSRSTLTDSLLDFLLLILVPVNVSSNVSIWRSLRSLPDLRYNQEKLNNSITEYIQDPFMNNKIRPCMNEKYPPIKWLIFSSKKDCNLP